MKQGRAFDLEAALLDPALSFDEPQDVVKARDLSNDVKLRLLKQWERDARALSVAEEEGMTGGEGYEKRGVGEKEAERRAWATVNKMTGVGKKRGSGVGKRINKAPARKGGRLGGAAAGKRLAAQRRASARKAARTRARRKSA